MRVNNDNPPYVTVTEVSGRLVINHMEWDDRCGSGYTIVQSRAFEPGPNGVAVSEARAMAEAEAQKIAEKEGLEYR